MNFQTMEWLKVIVPPAAAVAIVFIGAWLTGARERRHWLNDCRKEEYKELLNALMKATIAILQDENMAFESYMRPEKAHDAEDCYLKAIEVIGDRIFIADDLKKMKIRERWIGAMKALRAIKNTQQFSDTVEAIHNDLVEAAKKPI